MSYLSKTPMNTAALSTPALPEPRPGKLVYGVQKTLIKLRLIHSGRGTVLFCSVREVSYVTQL